MVEKAEYFAGKQAAFLTAEIIRYSQLLDIDGEGNIATHIQRLLAAQSAIIVNRGTEPLENALVIDEDES